MESPECFPMGFCTGKARIIAEAIEGLVTKEKPASPLRAHPCVQVFLDAQAASSLRCAQIPAGTSLQALNSLPKKRNKAYIYRDELCI